MKRMIPVLACVLVCLLGCNPKSEDVSISLSISPQSLSFSSDETVSKILTITSDASWTATPAANWIHLSKSSGDGNSSVMVSVSENATDSERSADILFVASKGGKEQKLSVGVNQGNPKKTPVVPDPKLDGNKRASTTYQLLVYSFADSDGDGIGDFKGIQDHLDYLESLGATAIWLSPAHPTTSYHAYNVNDYFALNPLYATGSHTAQKAEADFKELVDAAHEKGIKIYMDYVLNHSGTETEWFKSVKADPKNSPYRDYYVLSNGPYPKEATGGMGAWHSLGDGNPGYKGRLHFKVDWSKKNITVTESTEAHQDSNPSASLWLWIGTSGHFVGLYETSTNVFEITQDVDTNWGFLVTTTNNWDNAVKWGGKMGENLIKMGEALTLDKTTAADLVFGEATSYWASFDGSMPDLNYGEYAECENSRAFKSTVESAKKWVNLGVDGFRLDAVIWVYQAQLKANQRFLAQWYQAVNEEYRKKNAEDIFMVGETWCDGGHDGMPEKPERGGEKDYYLGLPSCFEFSYGYDLRDVLNSGIAGRFVSTFSGYISDHKSIRPGAITSLFLSNHDQERFGNAVGRNSAKEKQAAAILLTTAGKPYVYQGEELGYWGNQSNGDEYVRAPIVWDSNATQVAKKGVGNKVDKDMLTGAISVESQSKDAESVLNVYKTWGQLRNAYPALADGEMSATSISGASIASWYMTSGAQKLLVIHNVGSSDQVVSFSDKTVRALAVLGSVYYKDNQLHLGANSSVVFEL